MTKASDPAPAPELQALSTEALAEELAHLLRKHSSLSIPDDGDHLDQFWQTKLESIGIGTNDSHALDLMEYSLSPYFDEFRLRFPIEESTSSPGFHLFNGLYMAVDAHIYYALIRHLKPRQIIEIGNGYSIMLSAAACEFNREQHGHETQLVAIDPDPWDIFRNPYPGLSALIPQRVQDVPFERFAALEANDIVFIDPRHIIRRGNDVSYEYLEILPRLNAGVMVHIHGIGLPKTYPKQYYDDAISRGEQYLSQGVLTFNSHFEVVWPSNYMDVTYPDRVAAAFPELRLTRQHYPYFEPTAFWMKVRDPRQSSFAPTGDAGFLQTQTLRCLSQALPARRAGHSDASGTTGREGIADEFPTGQPDAVFGLAQASAGELPSAIAAFGRHLRNFPNDTAVAYRLASCLACCGCLDDADWIFSRRIELPLREDGSTNTEIITLWPGTGPFSDAASVGTLPYRRETAIELAGRATMKGVDLVYFVSCGFDRAKRFFPDLVRSIEAVGGFPVGVHIHIVNPDPECFRAIASLVEILAFADRHVARKFDLAGR